jgi:putative intracellular protease/amidase
MSPPRRALVSITSATAPLHFGNPTGMFISEAVHPFEVFRAAGFEVDIVSEKGTYTLDWLSQQPDFYSAKDRATFEDEGGEFRKKLDLLLTPDKVDAADVRLF